MLLEEHFLWSVRRFSPLDFRHLPTIAVINTTTATGFPGDQRKRRIAKTNEKPHDIPHTVSNPLKPPFLQCAPKCIVSWHIFCSYLAHRFRFDAISKSRIWDTGGKSMLNSLSVQWHSVSINSFLPLFPQLFTSLFLVIVRGRNSGIVYSSLTGTGTYNKFIEIVSVRSLKTGNCSKTLQFVTQSEGGAGQSRVTFLAVIHEWAGTWESIPGDSFTEIL